MKISRPVFIFLSPWWEAAVIINAALAGMFAIYVVETCLVRLLDYLHKELHIELPAELHKLLGWVLAGLIVWLYGKWCWRHAMPARGENLEFAVEVTKSPEARAPRLPDAE